MNHHCPTQVRVAVNAARSDARGNTPLHWAAAAGDAATLRALLLEEEEEKEGGLVVVRARNQVSIERVRRRVSQLQRRRIDHRRTT
jgi:hypothetical protein